MCGGILCLPPQTIDASYALGRMERRMMTRRVLLTREFWGKDQLSALRRESPERSFLNIQPVQAGVRHKWKSGGTLCH